MSAAKARKNTSLSTRSGADPLRLGLCCQFAQEPNKFRTTNVAAMLRLATKDRLARLAGLCFANNDDRDFALDADEALLPFNCLSPLRRTASRGEPRAPAKKRAPGRDLSGLNAYEQ